MNTRYSPSFYVLVLLAVVFFFQVGTASAAGTTYKCVGQPTTLSWSSSNVTSCTTSGTCYFSAVAGNASSMSFSASSGCSAGLTCTGPGGTASDSTSLVVDTTKTWNGSSCVTPACPANVPSTDTDPTSISTYCSSLGYTPPSGYQYPASISCNAAPGWAPYGPACTAPSCTGCSAYVYVPVAPSVPTAYITASPTSVAYAGQSTLIWSSTNATSCTAGGYWSNSGTLSGSGLTNPLGQTSTFTFQCSGPGGTSPVSSVTVSVGAPPPSSCSATTSSGCDLPATGSGGSAGTCNTGAGSCSYYCSNGAWSINSNSCTSSAPTASLSVSPSAISMGQSSTLTWSSTNATSCTSMGGFSTGSATSGSVSTGALTSSANYQISCTGSGGTANSPIATVSVLSPTATITATPVQVRSGNTSTIAWNASQVSSCTVSGPGLSSTSLSGSQSLTITTQSTYTITCQTLGAPITQSATVNVVPTFQQF